MKIKTIKKFSLLLDPLFFIIIINNNFITKLLLIPLLRCHHLFPTSLSWSTLRKIKYMLGTTITLFMVFLIPISPNLSRYNFKWISDIAILILDDPREILILNYGLYIFKWKFQTKNIVPSGDSSSSDHMVPKKETRLKLTIKKKQNHQDQTNLPQHPTKGKTGTNSLKWISSKVRLMKRKKTTITTTDSNKQHVNKDQLSNLSNLEGDQHDHLKKISTNQYNIIVNQNGYNGSNDCVIRTCSDCNTTKTPLWRSGPRGPKVITTYHTSLIKHICLSPLKSSERIKV